MAVGACPRRLKRGKVPIRVGGAAKGRRSKERRYVSGCVAPKRNWGINRSPSGRYNVTHIKTGYSIGDSDVKGEAGCVALALDDAVTGKTAAEVASQLKRRTRRTAITEQKTPLSTFEAVAPECYRWGPGGMPMGGKTFGKGKSGKKQRG